jgi:hypothetical protein
VIATAIAARWRRGLAPEPVLDPAVPAATAPATRTSTPSALPATARQQKIKLVVWNQKEWVGGVSTVKSAVCWEGSESGSGTGGAGIDLFIDSLRIGDNAWGL